VPPPRDLTVAINAEDAETITQAVRRASKGRRYTGVAPGEMGAINAEDAEKIIQAVRHVPTSGTGVATGEMGAIILVEDDHALAVLLLVLAGRALAGRALAGRPLHSTGALTIVNGLGLQNDLLVRQCDRASATETHRTTMAIATGRARH